jgi:hypothetical protein
MPRLPLSFATTVALCVSPSIHAWTTPSASCRLSSSRTTISTTPVRRMSRLHVSSVTDLADQESSSSSSPLIPDEALQSTASASGITPTTITTGSTTELEPIILQEQKSQSTLWDTFHEKIGRVEDDRYLFPEYINGDVPRLFSSLTYQKCEQGKVRSSTHAAGSVVGAAALVAGTTVGAGILALPTATVEAGFLPSSFAMVTAWIYMVRAMCKDTTNSYDCYGIESHLLLLYWISSARLVFCLCLLLDHSICCSLSFTIDRPCRVYSLPS